MAIDYNSGISSLQTGAPEIKYTGDQGPRSPDQQLMASADPMLVEMYQQYVFEMEEQGMQPMSFRQFMQQAMSGMAYGGTAKPTYTQSRKQRINAAGGGIMGSNAGSMLVAPTADGSRPGYGWISKIKDKIADIIPNEIKDPIMENPMLATLGGGALLNQFGIPFTGTPGDRMGQDWITDLISGPMDKAIQQGAQPLGYHPELPKEKQLTIPKAIPRPTDIISGGTGTGEGWLYNLGQGAKKLGQTIIPGGETGYGDIYGGVGNVLGGAGDVAKKTLQTILPGGDPGYVPDGLYRTAGQLLNPFSTAMAKTHPDDMIEAMKKTGITGERGVFTNTNTNKKAVPLEGWRKALATILPG